MTVELRWPLRHSDDSSEVEALVTGPVDRTSVVADLLANLPVQFGVLELQRITAIDQVPGHLNRWVARLRYGRYREKQELTSGDSEFRFTNGSRTFTRTISRSSQVYDSGGLMSPQPPDARIIGWNAESRTADGFEDEENVNVFGWSIIVPFTTATSSWRRQAGELRGSVNADPFFTYPGGSVLMEHMQSTVRADGEFRIEMNFMQVPNETNLNVGGVTVASKEGWEILDIDDQEFEEVGTPPLLVPTVKRVKVHRIKAKKDWSILSTLLGAALN